MYTIVQEFLTSLVLISPWMKEEIMQVPAYY